MRTRMRHNLCSPKDDAQQLNAHKASWAGDQAEVPSLATPMRTNILAITMMRRIRRPRMRRRSGTRPRVLRMTPVLHR